MAGMIRPLFGNSIPAFPEGLTKVSQTAAAYGAAPGIWLSPWGGYDGPKEQRLASARAQGFEINEGGFALSGPKYYRYFRDTCLDLIAKYGVNQFKFDGTGNANQVIKGSEFDSDFDAAIHLIGELRAKKPDLYVNLTTGTYPSPFWLLYADSIWRGGEDHSFAGVGIEPPALDHLSRLADLSPGRRRGSAVPHELAHAARDDLRALRQASGR